MAIRQMERGAAGEALDETSAIPGDAGHPQARNRRAASRGASQDWRPEDKDFWDENGPRIARRNLWISIPALLLSFAIWQVWSVVVAKLPLGRFHLHHRPALLARGLARPLGRDAAHLLFLHGADLRRPAVDHGRHLVAA